MAKEVILPKLGQTMEEGTIVKWLKNEGDAVKKGDILLEVQTDKAVLEVESFAEGTLLKTFGKEGEVIPVLSVIGYVGEPGEAVPDRPAPAAAPKKAAAPAAKAAPASAKAAPAAAPVSAPVSAPVIPQAAPVAAPGRLLISPRARKLVKEAAINPGSISGTGPEGRIVEKDVHSYLDLSGYYDLKISPTAKIIARDNGIDITTVGGSGPGGRITKVDVNKAVEEQPQPMNQMRAIIARRLLESKLTMPHFYATISVDMTDLDQLRKELKVSEPDTKISFNDFIVVATAQTLAEMPTVNAVCYGDTFSIKSEINIGIAVSIDDGLIVPVVKNADRKKIRQIAVEVRELAGKARSKKLTPAEYTGGSFTISNMGMMGIDEFAAIINPGEGAILAVSAITPTPVVHDGEICIRQIMKMTLSSDHRIIDGATSSKFLATLKDRIENNKWKV